MKITDLNAISYGWGNIINMLTITEKYSHTPSEIKMFLSLP